MTKSVFIKVVAGAGGVAVWLAVWQIATTVGPMSNVLGIPSMSASPTAARR